MVPHVRAASFGANVGKHVRLGIGDDCAILALPAGHETLVTTDLSIEGVHFRREWHPPESVGHRCLARGLSDIAAMGGEPVAAFVSLAAPASLPQKWVDGFYKGLVALARKYGTQLAGGDTSESPHGIAADIVVVGHVPAGKAIRRSGARPGDSIYITGELGRSAAILHHLERDAASLNPRSKTAAPHFFPSPRVGVGRELLRRGLASAMIDLSDGLSTDLAHICEESKVGALVAEHSIPRPTIPGGNSLHFALHGGEDYELLLTVPAPRTLPAKIAGVRVLRIGEIIRGRGVWLTDSHGQRKALGPAGWEHFR
jgi:thiamine-monophosphate kinase